MRRRLNLTGITLLLTLSGGAVLASEDQPVSGIVAAIPSPRIIGGISTSISQAPATVALLRTAKVQLDGDLFQAQYCAGTLIAARWVITAAHCVTSFFGAANPASSIMVLAGSSDLSNPSNQPISVKRIIRHPLYNEVEEGNDIALVQLEYEASVEPVALDVQPVQLNDLAFIAGWGAMNDKGTGNQQEFPTNLKGAFVNMTPSNLCEGLYPAYAGLTQQTNICAGVPEGGKDSCQGDSGGPLYRVDRDQNRIASLVGITSWGVGCGLPDYPGIYTNVAPFYSWIQSSLQITNSIGQPANDSVVPAPREPSELPFSTIDAAQQRPSGLSSSSGSRHRLGAFLPGLLLLVCGLLWRVHLVHQTQRGSLRCTLSTRISTHSRSSRQQTLTHNKQIR